jgi:hypothetical protein
MDLFRKIAVSSCLTVLALATAATAGAQVRFHKSTDRINVTIDSRSFTDFFVGPENPKPFLWPLRTESGVVVTRGFPIQSAPGESHDHPHHRGLFIGFGEINGVNFWENENSYTTTNRGRIVLQKLKDVKGGGKSGKIRAIFEWRDPSGVDIMDEDRTMTFYSEKGRRTIDFDIAFTAKAALHWADTKEGFFAIRVADSMNEKHGGKMVNSEGAIGEKAVWGKPAKWVDYSGQVNGQEVGIAIFANPGNPRFPPRWHSRAYGLFAVNPWGLKDFIGEKTAQGGGLNVASGETMRVRYRVVIHGADITPLNIPDLFQEYVNKTK